MADYYNTTHESGRELSDAVRQAGKQDAGVMLLFTRNPTTKATASQVLKAGIDKGYFDPKTPITSIRRSLTNMTKAGKLVKLDEKKKGPHARSEYKYTLNPTPSL